MVERIHHLSGGHPFLIQFIMHDLVQRKGDFSLDAVEVAGQGFLNTHADKFRAWWDRFDENSRRLFAALRDTPAGISRTAAMDLIGAQAADRGRELLCHTGVASEAPDGDAITSAGELFGMWFDRNARADLLPSEWQEDRLLYRVERRLRTLLANHLEKRDGAHWYRALTKRAPQFAEKLEKTARRPLANHPAPLEFSDFGDLFELVSKDWSTLGSLFAELSTDKTKQKTLFDERRTVLVQTRNDIRHARMHEIDAVRLAKARAYALELERMLATPQS